MTEAEIETMLSDAGLAPGSIPLTQQQLNDRVMAVMDRQWPLPMREAKPAEFEQWRSDMEPARVAAVMANIFNVKLAAYRQANARLARYRLADGRSEQAIETPTGAVDPETGDGIVVTRTLSAIAPLPPEIEQPAYDPVTGEETGSELVPNPIVVQDDAERATAQAVIDATPKEVLDFATAG